MSRPKNMPIIGAGGRLEMVHQDALGQNLTLSVAEASGHWNKVVQAFLAHSSQTPVHLERTLTCAPDFALGWAAKGLFYLLLGRSELIGTAREALGNARSSSALMPVTSRERVYVDALALYLDGRPSRAADLLDDLLARYPRDTLALKLSQSIRFLLGDRFGMFRGARAAFSAYDQTHPYFGYASGCMAFAYEESGDFRAAEQVGRTGLLMAPDDAWGLHAVAHVYDMTARDDEGIAWLEGQTSAWAHCNNFGYHVWWHLGLFYLDQGDFEKALALYDQKVRAEHTDDFRDIANGASMLVRLELEGVDVGDRWEELAQLSAGRVEDGAVIFADLHYLMALNGGQRDAEADRLVSRIAQDAQRTDHDMHEVAAVAGLPMALGLAAFRAGHYDTAFEQLRSARLTAQRIGGSHAQRDVFSRLLIEAGIRAGRWSETEDELVARARRRGGEDGFTARRRASLSRLAGGSVAAE